MKIEINLGEGNSNWLHPSRSLGGAIKPILEALTTVDLIYLTTHHVPLLYQSGVRYQEEPRQSMTGSERPIEEFASVPEVFARKWGDCDDLAPWRCAELRKLGFQARIRVQWKKFPNGKMFHIVVRRDGNVPDFNPRYMVRDGNTVIEDPSRALGMP